MPPLRCGPGHCGCSCPACSSPQPGRRARAASPSNRGSLHLGFSVAILHMLLLSCKPHASSATRSSKASARCSTFSPHGCCFCFAFHRAAITFCGPCHLWLRSPLRKPMTRLSLPALRICWGPAHSRTTRSALPSSLSSKVPSTCGLRSPLLRPPIGPRGPTLFVVARLGASKPVGPTLRGVLQSQAAHVGCRDLRCSMPPSPMSQATTCVFPDWPIQQSAFHHCSDLP